MNKRFTSRLIVVLLCVMVAVSSSQAFSRQFGGSLGNALKTTSLGNKSISDVFGKGNMTNIYSTSLGIIKGNQTNVSFASIDAIMKMHPEFVTCNVSADDVLNVLYDSNPDFRLMLKLTVMNKSKKKISEPSEREIFNGYKRIIRCRKLQVDFLGIADSKNVSNVLNAEYEGPIDTILNQQTIKQYNFGDDIFQNGTLDDSDYDLLVDIDKIGKKFFESFTTPPQTLFYEMFQPSGNSGGPGSDTSSGGGGPQSSQNTDIAVVDTDSPLLMTGAVTGAATVVSRVSPSTSIGIPTESDSSAQAFIENSNTQVFPPSNLYALPASACTSGVAVDLSLSSGDVTTPDQIADIIQEYIDTAGIDYELGGSPLFPTPVLTSGSTTTTNPVGSPNERVEQGMDSIGGGACGQECNSLPEGDKQACQTDCMVACIAKCDDAKTVDLQACENVYQATLRANEDKNAFSRALLNSQARTDKTSCQSDANGTQLACKAQCLCFTIGGPVGEKWEGMENMYKIKFCTIPVQVSSVSKGKKVYSIQDIFTEIKKVFDALVNKGEMIKRVPAKEFFDTTLAELKFGDLFTFQVVTQIKPLFARISKSTQKKELTQTNDNYESAILGMTPDDKNKYVIIADIAGNKAQSQNFKTLDEYNQKVAELETIEKQSVPALPAALKVASDDNTTNLNEAVKNFMISNMNFWKIASQTLREINNLADLLKTTIESKG